MRIRRNLEVTLSWLNRIIRFHGDPYAGIEPYALHHLQI
jgi:hypothetical protein